MPKIPYSQRNGNRPVGMPFRAKYAGTCRRCNKPYSPGELLKSNGRGQGAYHSICLRPSELDAVADQVAAWSADHDFSHYVQLRDSAAARDRKLVKNLQVASEQEVLPQSDRPDYHEGMAVADD